jgi:1,4-alpha-glucan branching enzyme
MVSREELRRFHAGRSQDAYRFLGAHCVVCEGRPGAWFSTWAPHARSVSVVGDFNQWDGRRNPMQRVNRAGVWQLFIPGVEEGTQYKFELVHGGNGRLVIKTDPYSRAFVTPGNTNAQVAPAGTYRWNDAEWLARRRVWPWPRRPINVYEVHLGSWRKRADGTFLAYEQLAAELSEYARRLHFTHLELLPVFEHPLDESLGYQVTGYYAPTSRFGSPDGFRAFVDRCHQQDIGVILDWVPLHFPKDDFALVEFDGAPLYERDDPEMVEHPEWRTLIFNYGRPEVRSFLLSNALYWLREFHVDGLRVDAVSSMLYLDDARGGKNWKPNPLGGRENLAAVRFLREMNAGIAQLVPDALIIAEEASSWPAVSQPPVRGGLGFSMKWNMGWIHDTLRYLELPWSERPAHHADLTFERLYARFERFMLALSHDESSPARGPLLRRLYGDEAAQFAQLRLLFTFLLTYPGKKLSFMGNEFGQRETWNPLAQLDWLALADPRHAGMSRLTSDLGGLYCALPALHAGDFNEHSFRWLDPDDARHSVISYLRSAGEAFALVILNFSADGHNYSMRAPIEGSYRIVLTSDAREYGGAGETRLIDGQAKRGLRADGDATLAVFIAPLTGAVIVPA